MEIKKKSEKNNKKSEITTIKLERTTKQRLDKLKEHERETYNQVIRKLLNTLNIFTKNPVLGNKILKAIEASRLRREKYTEVYQTEENKKSAEK